MPPSLVKIVLKQMENSTNLLLGSLVFTDQVLLTSTTKMGIVPANGLSKMKFKGVDSEISTTEIGVASCASQI